MSCSAGAKKCRNEREIQRPSHPRPRSSQTRRGYNRATVKIPDSIKSRSRSACPVVPIAGCPRSCRVGQLKQGFYIGLLETTSQVFLLATMLSFRSLTRPHCVPFPLRTTNYYSLMLLIGVSRPKFFASGLYSRVIDLFGHGIH